ncbi:UDP-glucose 6-dehydrogenase [Candidatus Roizmanbacteria bacterium CG03_land_8_20_14_0_80_39_12]|uniref:UDP-glucose 6-dehydrogenase n=1 Tax=Candidatus Roizmanbacteria bacterium CG03_land_8_20_14_0_80_39_12 TaxID=1974847 RepID=A0A2M7BT62_9BACT|nr:MAG: UDP-glucose 6-dehydrogenase [Candidatus Roizmanbacteria bacterium CG03_land_8_20_14_0_80_39_12]
MTITIVGHGYVGLVSACVFADFGNTVYVIGHTSEKLERLKNGDPIIYEPGLKEVLEKNNKAGRLKFTTEYAEAVSSSEIVFITVGTPPKENGEADLSVVLQVAEQIGKNLSNPFTVISCKSTVPVGTNKKIEEIINKVKKNDVQFAVASCPEFLREGSALHDTFQADRVVIGSESQKAINLLLKIHAPIPGKKVITDLASAELIKYTSNSVLAMKISFANLISFYCEKTGANVEMVLDAVGLDKRIGRIFMDPGVGYGGSCFPKDVKALISTGKQIGVDTQLLEAVDTINEQARINLLNKIVAHAKGKKIAIWGLSFKPNTDDIRFAPSVDIIRALLEKGYILSVYDQEGMNNVKKLFGNKLTYSISSYDALKDADALVILTEWNEFKNIDLKEVKKLMKQPMIFDGRNMYDMKTMKELGFSYISTGRESILL